MIELEFENNGSLQTKVTCNNYDATVEFFGKNYVKNTADYVIISNIYFKDLILPELFEFTTMITDNKDYLNLTNVNYVSFNGIWQLNFTEEDIKLILEKKLT
jgi:hypothetical protein